MGRKKPQEQAKKTCQEIRSEVRSYIRNERDTVLKKWMALEEAVRSEDHRRDAFFIRRKREDTKSLPINIQKFIGTLKRAVRKTMRDKGGTPFSIVRQMFLYWDADKSGEMSAEELKGCMNSLGVRMTDAEREEVVAYYDSGKGTNEMTYDELLSDISIGEPTIIHYADKRDIDEDAVGPRYEEVADVYIEMPDIVNRFVEATRNYVMTRMRIEGGTPYFHIRNLFQFFDYDYSNGLSPLELQCAARKKMCLSMSDEQARAIVQYYDRKNEGQMEYHEFLKDVSTGTKPILHFIELTPRGIAAAKKSLAANPFVPRPFKAPDNKVLENFKRQVKLSVAHKVNSIGGNVFSWIKEAFSAWDPKYTKMIKKWEDLQGAAKRLHVDLNEEEAKMIISSYDVWGRGEMLYMEFFKDMMKEDPHFLIDAPSVADLKSQTATYRTPASVSRNLRQFRASVEQYTRKSGGVLQARDVLHGTMMRFDKTHTGRLNLEGLVAASHELSVRLSEEDLEALINWFDTNGTKQLDYNAFTRQLFGDDVMTRSITLPKLNKHAGAANYTLSSTYVPGATEGKLHGHGLDVAQSGGGSTSSSASGTDGSSAPKSKNMAVIESQTTKAIRLAEKRNQVLIERARVQAKLDSIEAQRKKVHEDFRQRRIAEERSRRAIENAEKLAAAEAERQKLQQEEYNRQQMLYLQQLHKKD